MIWVITGLNLHTGLLPWFNLIFQSKIFFPEIPILLPFTKQFSFCLPLSLSPTFSVYSNLSHFSRPSSFPFFNKADISTQVQAWFLLRASFAVLSVKLLKSGEKWYILLIFWNKVKLISIKEKKQLCCSPDFLFSLLPSRERQFSILLIACSVRASFTMWVLPPCTIEHRSS